MKNTSYDVPILWGNDICENRDVSDVITVEVNPDWQCDVQSFLSRVSNMRFKDAVYESTPERSEIDGVRAVGVFGLL